MPVPSSLATLSQTPLSNSPAGSDAVFPLLDDYIREIFAGEARLRDGAHQFLTGVSGVDTITASNAQIGAYVAGQSFVLPAAGANTGPVTLNINGLGAKAVTKNGTTALAAGDIPAGKLMRLEYDGTRFQIAGSIYRDFLSNAVNAYLLSSEGKERLYFGSNDATSVRGHGTTPVMFRNAAGTILGYWSSAGECEGSVNATSPTAFPRLGQVQALDTAVQTAATAAATSAATTAAQNAQLGGPAQTWQNVLASRTIATNYTNSTGRPIFVRVTGQTVAGPISATMLATIDPAGTPVYADSIKFYGNAGGYEGSIGFIVPAGATYRVDIVNCNLNIWSELR